MEILGINPIWSNTETNDPNDGTIIVYGTSDKEVGLQAAKDLFKRQVTDVNGCIAQTWGAETYRTHPNRVFVWMNNVG